MGFTTILTLATVPRATANFEGYPWAGVVVVLNMLAIANIPRAMYQKPAGLCVCLELRDDRGVCVPVWDRALSEPDHVEPQP